MTLETLSTIGNPLVIYAKQSNIAHGPQQLSNGAAATRAGENENPAHEANYRANNDSDFYTRQCIGLGWSDAVLGQKLAALAGTMRRQPPHPTS